MDEYELFLEQAAQGCISGNVHDWPQLKPACQWAVAEIERLRAEVAWCHESLTRAHGLINPGMPAPDWHTVFSSLQAVEAAGREDGAR